MVYLGEQIMLCEVFSMGIIPVNKIVVSVMISVY